MVYLSKHTDPIMSSRQKQVIIGTILGGSSIIKPKKGKHCYLSMRGRDNRWMEYKARELFQFSSWEPFTIERTIRWHSLCYPVFDEFREKFYYNNKRRLQLDHLERLCDVAIAVWYGDCGIITKRKATMNTHIWGKKGTEIIKNYFDIIGYSAKILQERNAWRISLDEESTSKLFKLISPHIQL